MPSAVYIHDEARAGDGIALAGQQIAVKPDATGGANLAKAIDVNANGVAVKVDGSTIQESGSGQLEVPDGGIGVAKLAGGITEAEMAAAATQTITGDDQTIQHNDKSVVLLSSDDGENTYTLGASAAAIADGSVDGQTLLLLWHGQQDDTVIIQDNPPTSNCELQGDWFRGEGNNGIWLVLRWNASDGNWWETGRGNNFNTNSGEFSGSAGGGLITNSGRFSGSAGGGLSVNSGESSGSTGGTFNTNSGNNSGSVGGFFNTNTGISSCSAAGSINVNSGESSGSVGGRNNANSATYSGSVGGWYGECRHKAELLLAAYRRSAAGDAQATSYILKGTSTTDTLVELTSPERWLLEADRTVGFTITLIGRKSDGTKHAMYVIHALLARDGSNNTIIIGQNEVSVIETDATWDYEITNDDTSESIKISAKGASGETVYWDAHIIPVVCG